MTATQRKTWCRRRTSAWPAALTAFRTAPGRRPICARSPSTWPATTTGGGLVSLRHQLPIDDRAALRRGPGRPARRPARRGRRAAGLPHRQRDCLILRYYDELGVDDIATTLGISRNSVKTHLTRGVRALATRWRPRKRPRGCTPGPVGERVHSALTEATAAVEPAADLFASGRPEHRRRPSAARQRRRGWQFWRAWRCHRSHRGAAIDLDQGDVLMDWWILEAIWFAVMVGLALWLGPFIRRFGKSYAADVFRANPRTGQELHRADGCGLLPGVLRLHPVQRALRTGRQLGLDGQTRRSCGPRRCESAASC